MTALGQGQIFAAGIAIVLKGPNDALSIPDGAKPLKFLHFVDAAGNTIPPELVPDGLATPAGPLTGVKFTLPVSAAMQSQIETLTNAVNDVELDVSNLDGRVSALELQAGGKWNVTDPVVVDPMSLTGDYNALIGDLVQIDTTGATSGNISIYLPEATPDNKGRGVIVAEISAAGIDPGVNVLVWAQWPQQIGGGYNDKIQLSGMAASTEVRSTGTGWVVVKKP